MTRTVAGGDDGFDWDAYEAEVSDIDSANCRAPRHEPDPDEYGRRRIPPMNDLYQLPPHWGRLRRDRPE